MKTKTEILDEMVAHFETNPRAANYSSCMYLTKDGRRCGHSIFLRDEMVGRLTNSEDSAETVIEEFGDDIHKPEYRGHEANFWWDIQALHDVDHFWSKNNKGGQNLTEQGLERLQQLKSKWK